MRNVAMAMLGISHTVNTKVGSDFIREYHTFMLPVFTQAHLCLLDRGRFWRRVRIGDVGHTCSPGS